MELSEDMAGKIRKALAKAAPYVSTPDFVEATQFLDRLTPTEPEVDEATVWTRSVFDVLYPMIRIEPGFKSGTPLERARAVLNELIASKDGEIEHTISLLTEERDHEIERHDEWKKRALEWQEKWQKAEFALATLRAENERLKAAYVKYVAFDQPEAAERNTAEPAKTYVWPITHGDACSEIEATDDLAAHLVREILQTFHLEFNDEEAGQKMETIARRYMEKLFTEDELRDIVCHYLRSTWGCRTLQDSIRAVRTIRAGKDGR